ncbi:B-box zinc finger protein 32 [Sorghum bicolor]|jgi:hypothetical protein|uniref:B box-type domain-containing protein n=1 Tax=Sorghum bicolor TaxID=4558 RepID=A0A1W0VU96_SORBI|nr:B-box zinc finger protein 32 [Sorghum bicolor]OQU76824.1 hypothetical protein SORBI_3010G217532 [Sorghum bicolor]|eukprot:XP_002437405.1 B-box zinc finger protein 32 [Sorghum bicolor]
MGHGHGGGCRCCELCGAPAAVHCAADAAFLCAACDAKVHGANFLASRHHRTRLHLAGTPDEEEYESAAASSCVSTADSASSSAAPRRRRRPAPAGSGSGSPRLRPPCEAVLEAWAKRAGLAAGAAARRRAARAVRACAHDLASARVPPRVAMAAALWREVAGRGGGIIGAGGGGGCGHDEALRRLEACAHVPARLVVAVATSLARARARRRRRAATDAVEGWDECAWAGPKSSPARS